MAKKTSPELSACLVTATEAICELYNCPVTAKEAAHELTVCPALRTDPGSSEQPVSAIGVLNKPFMLYLSVSLRP